GRMEGDQGAEAGPGDEADGGGAEAERDEAVVGGGRAAALERAEDERAGLVAGALLDLRGEALRNAAQPRGAARARGFDVDRLAVVRHGALGRDDDGEPLPVRVALLDLLADLLDVVGDLREKEDIRVARGAGAQRDPAS